jgi:hypothetical protein
LVVIAHDVRRRTLLALTSDAILRANARLARGAVGVGAIARTTSDATRRAVSIGIRNLWGWARLARWRSSIREFASGASCALGLGQASSGTCLARDAKEALVVREGGSTCWSDSAGRAQLAHGHRVAGVRGVAWACVAPTFSGSGAIVVAVVIARVIPHVLVGVGIRNEDLIDAITVEVAHDGAV